MDFELTPEQQTLQKAAIEFARPELNSNMIERDAQQVFSHDGWKKCAAFGVQGMPIPKEYGGRGGDPITIIAMMEGLGYGGLGSGIVLGTMRRQLERCVEHARKASNVVSPSASSGRWPIASLI